MAVDAVVAAKVPVAAKEVHLPAVVVLLQREAQPAAAGVLLKDQAAKEVLLIVEVPAQAEPVHPVVVAVLPDQEVVPVHAVHQVAVAPMKAVIGHLLQAAAALAGLVAAMMLNLHVPVVWKAGPVMICNLQAALQLR